MKGKNRDFKFIDAHVHLPKNDVKQLLNDIGNNRAIILPIASKTRNEKVAAIVAEYDHLIGFASVNPLMRGSDLELEYAICDLGLKGLKLHPQVQGFCPSNPAIFPLMKKAEELGIPVMFHTGPTWSKGGRIYDSFPHHIDDLAIGFPDLPIIMAHMGGVRHTEAVMVAMRHENVYLDISMTLFYLNRVFPQAVEWVFERCKDKLIFGSDYPYYGIHEAYEEFLKIADKVGLKRDMIEDILKNNILRLISFQ